MNKIYQRIPFGGNGFSEANSFKHKQGAACPEGVKLPGRRALLRMRNE
jgi:hypothetical protein